MCMRELLRRDADWRYFLNPAASELPLVTVEEMENTLRHIGGSIVESYPLPKGNMHRLRDHPVTWRTGGNQVKICCLTLQPSIIIKNMVIWDQLELTLHPF